MWIDETYVDYAGSAESLERFASRLGDPELQRARDAVLRYAALRYGQEGDAASLEAELHKEASRLRSE